MNAYKLKGLFTEKGWVEDVTIVCDEVGKITAITTGNKVQNAITLNAFALPGFQNAHSHAFQYAMAGLAETHSTAKAPDDFWSWREAMYALALQISPDDIEAIATMLYSEMLRHGYTNVAEFHYVHHDRDGQLFSNLSEMGERLVKAAKRVGIGITLIPIFYQKGGFGKPPTEGQKRFISEDQETYLRLLEASKKSTTFYEHATIGLGIHSMRGVDPKVIAKIAHTGPQDIPFHIHVSEQLKEVEDSLNYLGQRPVEWLLNNIALTDRFHLVHATHLTTAETDGIAKQGANVVLCPSTEGNLGDGIFPLKRFQEQGGKWSIGTDSHIGLNPFEELRILDYGQRLTTHKRNTFYSTKQGDSGVYAIDMALRAGRKAMNNYETTYFKVGDFFDAVLMDANSPLVAATKLECLLPTFVYASDVSIQYGTIAKGKLVVKEGRHTEQYQIRTAFYQTIKRLANR